MEVKSISKDNLCWKQYKDAKDLATEICCWVKKNEKAATLAFDRKWWAKAVISPYVGHYTNWSIGFPQTFPFEMIVKEIEKNGCYFNPDCLCSEYGVVFTKKLDKSFCIGNTSLLPGNENPVQEAPLIQGAFFIFTLFESS